MFFIIASLGLIESDIVGSMISEKITKYLKRKHNSQLSFQNLSIGLFPPTTTLKNVYFENDMFRIQSSKISSSFGLRDFFVNKFTIGILSLKDTILTIKNDELANSDDSKEISPKEVFTAIDRVANKNIFLRIRKLSLKSSLINVGNDYYALDFLSITHKRKSYSLALEASVHGNKMISRHLSKIGASSIDGVSLYADFYEDKINVQKGIVYARNDYAELSGSYSSNGDVTGGILKSNISIQSHLRNILSGKIDDLGLLKGTLGTSIKFSSVDNIHKVSGGVTLNNFKSRYVDFDKLDSNFAFEDNKVRIDNAYVRMGRGEASLVKPLELFTIRDQTFQVNESLKVEVSTERLASNHFLKFLPSFDPLRFNVSGNLMLDIKNTGLNISALENVAIEDLSLGKFELPHPIVDIKNLKIIKGDDLLKVKFKKGLKTNLKVVSSDTEVYLKGGVNKKGINISYSSNNFNFENIGKIANEVLIGRGHVHGTARGAFDDVVLMFDFRKIKSFEIKDFKLGKVDSNVSFYLKNNKLRINTFKSKYKSALITGKGIFDFSNKKNFSIKLKASGDKNYDVRASFEPVLGPLSAYASQFGVSSSVESEVSVSGPFKVEEIKAQGVVTLKDVKISGESIDQIKAIFSFNENLIQLNDIVGRKASGIARGNFKYDLADKAFQYNFNLEDLRIRDIDYYKISSLGLDGYLAGSFTGLGDKGKFSSRNDMRVLQSKVGRVSLSDSVFAVHTNDQDVLFNGNFIDGEFKTEGFLNLKGKGGQKSKVTVEVNTDKLKKYFGILSLHNMTKGDLVGQVAGKASIDFNLAKLDDLNLLATMQKLNFSYDGIKINNLKEPLDLVIRNGFVEKWDVDLPGDKIRIISKASGKLGRDFKLLSKTFFDASLFELINKFVENAKGDFVVGADLIFDKGNYKTHAYLNSDKSEVKLLNLSGIFTNVFVDVSLIDKKAVIKEFSGSFGGGTFSTKGNITFDYPYPAIALKSSIKNSTLNLFKKSNLLLGANLRLDGKKIPYVLSGNVRIQNGNILESMESLASSVISVENYKKFLPAGYVDSGIPILSLNLNADTGQPVLLRNGMIDIALVGKVKMVGSYNSPLLNGNMSIANSESKFVFKGHEFFLNEGEIRLLDTNRKEKPELSFIGTAKVNEYTIFLTVNGAADSMSMTLESSPSLPQEDILSLLTLGVTSDVSRQLGQSEMRSVTNLSIGSLIVDQLQINKGLNDSLGLRVSVQPEFQQNNETLLGGRTEDTRNVSRLRSTTKVQVHKKISKEVDMSISSTLGGSVEQTQKMNLNYRIDKGLSIEGVYQVQSGEGIEAETPESIGADLKWQWSF
jgi:translocation and assembly module TamB